jgi:hypothetical protein
MVTKGSFQLNLLIYLCHVSISSKMIKNQLINLKIIDYIVHIFLQYFCQISNNVINHLK